MSSIGAVARPTRLAKLLEGPGAMRGIDRQKPAVAWAARRFTGAKANYPNMASLFEPLKNKRRQHMTVHQWCLSRHGGGAPLYDLALRRDADAGPWSLNDPISLGGLLSRRRRRHGPDGFHQRGNAQRLGKPSRAVDGILAVGPDVGRIARLPAVAVLSR